MRSVILLLTLVAASQAGFTGSISQQAKPIIQDAVFKMRAVSRTSTFRENEVVNAIINGIQLQTEHVISQIDNALAAGQALANDIVGQIQSTVQNLHVVGQHAVTSVANVVNHFLSSLHALLADQGQADGRADGALSQTIMDLINQFNLEHHVVSAWNHPVTQTMVNWAASLIQALGFSDVAQTAVSAVLGQDLAAYIFGQLNSRGLFDDLAAQISAATQQIVANVQATVQQFATVVSENYAQLQALVAETVQQVATQTHENLEAACNQLLETLKPFQEQLGALYQQTVDQIHALLGKN
jgi:ElaB/YqjD/DUF883 family membrane-anchored ribosome-binding protein